MFIEADDLTVQRLGRTVLRDISIRIDSGQCVSVIGPNGAGKSTLMSSLLNLLPRSSGQVRLAGKPIDKMSRRQIARKIAYVPQTNHGYLGFCVRDVLETGRYAHLDPLASLAPSDRSAIESAVSACRIEDLLERTLDTLSGGEQQKVWIAAALAQQAEALFLDEPTNSLDPAHQAELIRIMKQSAQSGHTLLVICHDLNLPIALGGRVIAVRQGSAYFEGAVDALTNTDLLEDLFGTEFVICRSPDSQSPSIQLRI